GDVAKRGLVDLEVLAHHGAEDGAVFARGRADADGVDADAPLGGEGGGLLGGDLPGVALAVGQEDDELAVERGLFGQGRVAPGAEVFFSALEAGGGEGEGVADGRAALGADALEREAVDELKHDLMGVGEGTDGIGVAGKAAEADQIARAAAELALSVLVAGDALRGAPLAGLAAA